MNKREITIALIAAIVVVLGIVTTAVIHDVEKYKTLQKEQTLIEQRMDSTHSFKYGIFGISSKDVSQWQISNMFLHHNYLYSRYYVVYKKRKVEVSQEVYYAIIDAKLNNYELALKAIVTPNEIKIELD